MVMTNEEIVRDYLQARNKSKQIKVLADLNTVAPAEIRAVLAEACVEGIEAPKRIVRKRKPAPPEAEAPPSVAPEPPRGGRAGHLPENREHPRRPSRRNGAQSPLGRGEDGGRDVRGVPDGAAEVGRRRSK